MEELAGDQSIVIELKQFIVDDSTPYKAEDFDFGPNTW